MDFFSKTSFNFCTTALPFVHFKLTTLFLNLRQLLMNRIILFLYFPKMLWIEKFVKVCKIIYRNFKMSTFLQNLSNIQKYAHSNFRTDIMTSRNEFSSHFALFNNNQQKYANAKEVPKPNCNYCY